jgi:hypothetical protein
VSTLVRQAPVTSRCLGISFLGSMNGISTTTASRLEGEDTRRLERIAEAAHDLVADCCETLTAQTSSARRSRETSRAFLPLCRLFKKWARLVSNQRPLACEASAGSASAALIRLQIAVIRVSPWSYRLGYVGFRGAAFETTIETTTGVRAGPCTSRLSHPLIMFCLHRARGRAHASPRARHSRPRPMISASPPSLTRRQWRRPNANGRGPWTA